MSVYKNSDMLKSMDFLGPIRLLLEESNRSLNMFIYWIPHNLSGPGLRVRPIKLNTQCPIKRKSLSPFSFRTSHIELENSYVGH